MNKYFKFFLTLFLYLQAQFNSAQTNSLFGINISSGYLGKIDPATGNFTAISTSSMTGGVNQGVSAVDPIHNRLFFTSFHVLYTVDIATGNVIYSSNLKINVPVIEYNCFDSSLYAINIDGGADYLGKIDPATGNYTAISTSPIAFHTQAFPP